MSNRYHTQSNGLIRSYSAVVLLAIMLAYTLVAWMDSWL